MNTIDFTTIDLSKEAPVTEPDRQYYFIAKAREYVQKQSEELGRALTFCVTTFGCQMNARDSEKLSGILEQIGYVEETDEEKADFVIYNTCTVRENANQRVYGRLGQLNRVKKQNPHMMIGLCGCMMQEPEVVEKLKKSYRFVDLIFGIVPYVRGRERSRNPEDIIREIENLVADGVVEVMLLGQNVNSYGKTLKEPMSFAQLLQEIEKIEGLKRIRFMTSHPKDLSDELIEVMRTSKKICKHLHLPIQSGSTRILEKMNRRYTKEHYLELVDKIRAAVPDISLTTDIIVGFPGETEEDFLETMDVVKKVRYDSAFTFIYSKRTGTPAAVMEDQIPEEVVKDRFDRLLKEVQSISSEVCSVYTDTIQEVLVETVNDHDPSLMTGRMSNNLLVHFPGDKELIGKIVPVKLKECKGFYYIGERVPATE